MVNLRSVSFLLLLLIGFLGLGVQNSPPPPGPIGPYLNGVFPH